MIYRVYVEKKDNIQANKIRADLEVQLGIGVEELRELIRYDAEGLSADELEGAIVNVFSEPPVDFVYREKLPIDSDSDYKVFAIAFLDGQYDQRADSAAQCIQLLTQKKRPLIKCARIIAVKGVTEKELSRIKKHLINPVECAEVSLEKPDTLARAKMETHDVSIVDGFIDMNVAEIADYHKANGFAMSVEDLVFVRDYFKKEGRNPTETEVKVIDTYWSDHCRHTTFSTEIQSVDIHSDNPYIQKAYALYKDLFAEFNRNRAEKYPCLMDIATIAVKKLKKEGKLDNLDVSDEINACSICIDAEIDGKVEKYLVMFKNETHNHPTEIEPFGGAATCLGGAIRDPLSGRTYVYQAMRITGSADPREKIEDTLPGKLPQRVITRTAAAGFSSYGNQIGLATGIVDEIYHDGYKAKRLETGFVVGGAKKEMVYREKPQKGDVILLLGGETGRDGCGGATGSSKAHDAHSVETCGAEVQKGNPLTERKLQRLFLNKKATRMIKKCNDFGAGGVSVAIGELSDGLVIDLDQVPLKYEGLTGTELAISESQERMAVVVDEKNCEEFICLAAAENLSATPVAVVTDDRHMRMLFKGREIVNISRDFLDTNGVKQIIRAEIDENAPHYFDLQRKEFRRDFLIALSDLNVCSKKGLSEMFDSTIGARSVYMPFGGKTQLTPAIAMAAKICGGETDVATVSAYGYCAKLMSESPFAGAIYSIVTSVAKLVAAGCDFSEIRLTFQEYFMRLNRDPKRWGVPLSALLGALYAQIGLGLGAIGGKDSMSGSFEQIDVPPTLISFALAPAKASRLITNVLGRPNQKIYWIPLHKDFSKIPDFAELIQNYQEIYRNICDGNIRFATVVENGGIATAIAKSCFGNELGFRFEGDCDCLLSEHYGEILVTLEDPDRFAYTKICVGETTEDGNFVYDKELVLQSEAVQAFCGTLDSVFPNHAVATGKAKDVDFERKEKHDPKIANKIVKPRVFIPVFPGTNCELDTARKFKNAGAECEIVVVRNRNATDIEESVRAIATAISRSNIIAFPGGFSGGDEPDGSGKFIATTFRNPFIAEQIERLLHDRDGLILGICNGFQALIKLGLVPYGKILPLESNSPTLTHNNIARHVSTLVDIRVASNLSPWLSACKVGDVFTVPVSHGEGKLVAPSKELERMAENGQIATQYCDRHGHPTMEYPFNPNGSAWGIEGITSPDGRIFGKMGHTERTDTNLYKNSIGNFDMKLFESGVQYFR